MKWLFCVNNRPIISEENEKINANEDEKNKILTFENTFKEDDFDFINQFITEEYLENMFDWGIQWRKQLALKGKGCQIKKVEAINSIINILLFYILSLT